MRNRNRAGLIKCVMDERLNVIERRSHHRPSITRLMTMAQSIVLRCFSSGRASSQLRHETPALSGFPQPNTLESLKLQIGAPLI